MIVSNNPAKRQILNSALDRLQAGGQHEAAIQVSVYDALGGNFIRVRMPFPDRDQI
jgi:hypothetical protein